MIARSRLPLVLAVLLVVPASLRAQEASPEDRIRETIAEHDRALADLDVDALRSLLSSTFSRTSFLCTTGEDNRESAKSWLGDLRKIADAGGRYQLDTGPLEVSLLGGGPIGVAKRTVTETLSFETGSLSLRAAESFYLDEIGGRYRITSARTRTACNSMKVSGTLPDLSGG